MFSADLGVHFASCAVHKLWRRPWAPYARRYGAVLQPQLLINPVSEVRACSPR
jgi:hypothetical protein